MKGEFIVVVVVVVLCSVPLAQEKTPLRNKKLKKVTEKMKNREKLRKSATSTVKMSTPELIQKAEKQKEFSEEFWRSRRMWGDMRYAFKNRNQYTTGKISKVRNQTKASTQRLIQRRQRAMRRAFRDTLRRDAKKKKKRFQLHKNGCNKKNLKKHRKDEGDDDDHDRYDKYSKYQNNEKDTRTTRFGGFNNTNNTKSNGKRHSKRSYHGGSWRHQKLSLFIVFQTYKTRG